MKSVADDKVLWGMELDKVRGGKADLTLIGASRLQLGFQVELFEEETGKKVANLAVAGSSPFPVLDYVANETDYSGLVVLSIMLTW